MLRFLHHIRKKLIEQNKIRTYILYGIGEIALVMIGILLALQVNNWNQERINSSEEQYYLGKLIQNLETDSTNLELQISALSLLTTDMDSALFMMVNEEEFESRKFTVYINSLLAIPVFIQNSVTYDNLIASGNISLISDQRLVNLLFTYYNPGNVYLNWDEASRHYSRNIFGPFLLDFDYLVEKGLDAGFINENYSRLEKPQHPYTYYKGSQKLMNYLNMKYRINTGQKQLFEENLKPVLNETLQVLRSNFKQGKV